MPLPGWQTPLARRARCERHAPPSETPRHPDDAGLEVMYSRTILETRLPMAQALEQLARIIRPRQSRGEVFEASLWWHRKPWPPFVGSIDGDRFTMRRVIPYRNSFRPLISGRVVPVASGSRIDLVIRLTTPVAVVMTVWLAMASVAAAAGVWHSIRTSEPGGLLALAFPLFGCTLVAIGFIPEKRKAVALLRDALQSDADTELQQGARTP